MNLCEYSESKSLSFTWDFHLLYYVSQISTIINIQLIYYYALAYLQETDRTDVVLSEQKKAGRSSSKSLKMNCAKRVSEHKKSLGKFNLKLFKSRKHKHRSSQAGDCEDQEERTDQVTAVVTQHVFNDMKISSTAVECTGATQIPTESETFPSEGDNQSNIHIARVVEQVKELERYLEITKDQKESLHEQLEDKDRQVNIKDAYVAEVMSQIKELQNHYSIAKAENEQLKSQLEDKNRQLNAKDIHIAEMTAEVKELEKSLCRATQKRLLSPDVVCTCNNKSDRLSEDQFYSAAEEMALILAEREQEIVSLQQQLEDIKVVSVSIIINPCDHLFCKTCLDNYSLCRYRHLIITYFLIM